MKAIDLQKVCLSDMKNHIECCLTQPIKMQLSQKQKNVFSNFFSAFFKAILNFERFQKEDDPHSLCISEVPDDKIGG